MPLENRYEFLLLFDCQNGNPNGDPDAHNSPRVDPEDLHGLVSDVALKRKIRNFVAASRDNQPPYSIFIEHGCNLNRKIALAHENTGGLPPKGKKATKEKSARARDWMCQTFFDVRAFGAVLNTGSNAGQVRGPVQLAFARSVEPVYPLDPCLTRAAVAEGEPHQSSQELLDWENAQPWNKLQTMARRPMIAYGLYTARGFISAYQAQDTGFDEKDLELLWAALQGMFELNRSAYSGVTTTRALYIFKHVGTDTDRGQRARQALFGCAPAHRLLENGHVLNIQRANRDKPARCFEDYLIEANLTRLPPGVEMTEIRC